MAETKKPFLCRLKLHSFTDTDGAWFTQIVICRRCGDPQSLTEAERLGLERQLMAEESANGGSVKEQLRRVASRLLIEAHG